MLYLVFLRLTGGRRCWPRSAASKDAGLLMLRQEVAVLRRQGRRPARPDSDRFDKPATTPVLTYERTWSQHGDKPDT